MPFQYVNKAHKKYRAKLSLRASCNRTSGNCFKPKEGRFQLDKRKEFFLNEGGKTLEQVHPERWWLPNL